MKSARAVSGLRYLPRQDGNPNGTIGRFTVTVSMDGTTFSEPVATGEFYDSPRRSRSASRRSPRASSA